MEDVLAALTRALERGEMAALVTIVAAHGSTPQRVGAKMLVFPDGRTVGTIGGGCYENDAFWKAREALNTRRAQLVHYELSDDLAEESGLICGGQMDVFIEPIEPAPRSTSSARATSAISSDRSRRPSDSACTSSTTARSSPTTSASRAADEVVVEDVAGWVRDGRDPRVGLRRRADARSSPGLRRAARAGGRELRYVGLIGSRAKVARLTDALIADGVSADWLRAAPRADWLRHRRRLAGRDRSAILAELIAVRRGQGNRRKGRPFDAVGRAHPQRSRHRLAVPHHSSVTRVSATPSRRRSPADVVCTSDRMEISAQ